MGQNFRSELSELANTIINSTNELHSVSEFLLCIIRWIIQYPNVCTYVHTNKKEYFKNQLHVNKIKEKVTQYKTLYKIGFHLGNGEGKRV